MVSHKPHTEELMMFVFKVLNFTALFSSDISMFFSTHGNFYYYLLFSGHSNSLYEY